MMISATVTQTINITDEVIIDKIRAMSPCCGLITLIKKVRSLMATEMPQHANLLSSRAIAEDAIDRGLVRIFPSYSLYLHLVHKAPHRCSSVGDMCKLALAFCEKEGIERPTLRDLHNHCAAMIENGHTTLRPDTSSAANTYLDRIISGDNPAARAKIDGRVFEDDIDASEALSAMADAETDQLPDTDHLRGVIRGLCADGTIVITDSAMMGDEVRKT